MEIDIEKMIVRVEMLRYFRIVRSLSSEEAISGAFLLLACKALTGLATGPAAAPPAIPAAAGAWEAFDGLRLLAGALDAGLA